MFSDLLFDCLNKFKIESGKDFTLRRENLERGILRERYDIKTDDESLKFNKPIGRYELMTIPDVLTFDEEDIKYCTMKLAEVLNDVLGKISAKDRILVVGLGNRHISSDSLGAKVVGKINITIDNCELPKVMAISPSVMGLTGIETVDIVEGVVLKTKATHLIIIDSLCASSPSRLGKSIQITNTGICPGGGVGNKRKCIDKNIAPHIFSIGVPLLIYASTFVIETLSENGITKNAINGVMQNLLKSSKGRDFIDFLKNISKVLNDNLDNMIVALKDIEECVELLSTIIANSINMALGVEYH